MFVQQCCAILQTNDALRRMITRGTRGVPEGGAVSTGHGLTGMRGGGNFRSPWQLSEVAKKVSNTAGGFVDLCGFFFCSFSMF